MDRNLKLAQAAGILDGEGCFGIGYDPRHNQYHPNIQVVMTDAKPLHCLLGLFGGSLSQTKMDPKGRKVPYHYTLRSKQCRVAIEQVLPFLIGKRAQAEVLLDLQRNIDEWNGKSRKRGNLPAEVLAYRAKLKETAASLKLGIVQEIPGGRRVNGREGLAYATGVLEAEGCFTIKKEVNTFRAEIAVQMSTPAVLVELTRIFGGTTAQRAPKVGRMAIWMWRVKGRQCADACRKITPYLTFRHEEVTILRELQNHIALIGRRGRGGLNLEHLSKREAWKARLHDIHKPARAETKSEQPARVSDSPVFTEIQGEGLARVVESSSLIQ